MTDPTAMSSKTQADISHWNSSNSFQSHMRMKQIFFFWINLFLFIQIAEPATKIQCSVHTIILYKAKTQFDLSIKIESNKHQELHNETLTVSAATFFKPASLNLTDDLICSKICSGLSSFCTKILLFLSFHMWYI